MSDKETQYHIEIHFKKSSEIETPQVFLASTYKFDRDGLIVKKPDGTFIYFIPDTIARFEVLAIERNNDVWTLEQVISEFSTMHNKQVDWRELADNTGVELSILKNIDMTTNKMKEKNKDIIREVCKFLDFKYRDVMGYSNTDLIDTNTPEMIEFLEEAERQDKVENDLLDFLD